MIYLDNAATTKIDPKVVETMMPYLTDEYGNPGGIYKFGRNAADAVYKARCQVAALMGCKPEQIIFTSGGSEANSLVFHGIKEYLRNIGKTHILVSAVEHDSVLRAAEALIKDGFDVEKIPVSPSGSVLLDSVESLIRPNTGLVSVMYVNNETGCINPVENIGALCRLKGILFHSDCVQAAGTQQINMNYMFCDFASISAHKIHGGKGIGALFVKDADKLSPIIFGGANQEYGLRGGTENTAGIVGFGAACEIAKERLTSDGDITNSYKERFYKVLAERLEQAGHPNHVRPNGASLTTPGKTLSVCFDGVDGETLLLLLDSKGICASAGSACRSHEAEPSHVLTAMGLSKEEARSSVRFSFSRMNTMRSVEIAASITAGCIDSLLE